jgi:hypothetical protein
LYRLAEMCVDYVGLPHQLTSNIGFLLTAKSILRFGEIKKLSQRRVAEYIIIVPLMSFDWSLSTAF